MDHTEEIFTSYCDAVYRLALSYTRSPQEAEDVCQTVFLKYMEHTVTPGKEKSWLMQVTANQCRSLLRSGWWKKTVPLEESAFAATGETGTVLQEVLRLPPKYRVVIFLHYYEGWSTEEIGSLLKISRTAVTTRLARARDVLKTNLKEV